MTTNELTGVRDVLVQDLTPSLRDPAAGPRRCDPAADPDTVERLATV